MKNCIIVFLKYPRIGEVKTRLAASIGQEIASHIYKNLCEITFEQCLLFRERYDTDIQLFCTPDKDLRKVMEWTNNNFIYKCQKGNSLGERLHHAFEEVHNEGYHKYMVIGTDAPEISADILEHALHALDDHDYILGKADDGGYYALGMKEFSPHVFENIKWSTDTVYKMTKNIMHSMNKKVCTLPFVLNDIDSEGDLLLLQKRNITLYSKLLE